MCKIDWNLIYSFTKILVWPGIVLYGFYYLRKPIHDLIKRISKVKWGSLDADLAPRPMQSEIPASENPISPELILPNPETLERIRTEIDAVDKADQLKNKSVPELNDWEMSSLNLVVNKLNAYNAETIRRVDDWINNEIKLNQMVDFQAKSNILEGYAKILYLNLVFERIYGEIFGTQIQLLEYLNSVISEQYENLDRFYSLHIKLRRSMNAGYANKIDYLGYLTINYMAIQDEKYYYSITDLGRDFLKYLTDYRKSKEKPF